MTKEARQNLIFEIVNHSGMRKELFRHQTDTTLDLLAEVAINSNFYGFNQGRNYQEKQRVLAPNRKNDRPRIPKVEKANWGTVVNA